MKRRQRFIQLFSLKTLYLVVWTPFYTLNPFPVQNLTNENLFVHLEISRATYYESVPLSSVFEIHRISETKDDLHLLVPRSIIASWDDRKIDYTVLPFPKKLQDIDPGISNRKKQGCIPLHSMLNGYKDPEINEIYIYCIQMQFPGIVKIWNIGKSVESRSLLAVRIRIPGPSEEKNRTPVFIHCGIHGNEMIAIEHCYDIMIQSLTNIELYPFLNQIDLWVLPVANPDGLYRHWYEDINQGRKNANGVDLNRNFPFKWGSEIPFASSSNPSHHQFRGFSPASEPEVQAILKLFERERFTFSMSIHCYANSILVPYSIPETRNPEPNLAEEIAKKLTKNIVSLRRDRPFTIRKNLYPVDGTDQDTFFHRYGTLAYLFETSHLLERYLYVPLILEDMRSVYLNLLKEISRAYKWRIRIMNTNGDPIPANVSSNTYTYFEGEFRKASVKGNYEEVTPSAKEVSVLISSPGYKTKRLKISPSQNPDRYEIILNPVSQ